MDRIREFLPLEWISKKNISIIYALWTAINYQYLRKYLNVVSKTAYYGDFGVHENLAGFLSYIILTYSVVTFAYFSWIIWFNRENKDWQHNFIRVMISALILCFVIITPYSFIDVYEELPHWKYWGPPEWDSRDSNGNLITVSNNPALEKVSFISYSLCIIFSLSIYIRELSKETISHSVAKNIFQIVFYYILYGIASNLVFFVVSSPCFVLLAMARLRIIKSQAIRDFIYVLIKVYIFGTIAFCGVVGSDAMSRTGAGPVPILYIIALLGLFFNAGFYPVLIVWALIKGVLKLIRNQGKCTKNSAKP